MRLRCNYEVDIRIWNELRGTALNKLVQWMGVLFECHSVSTADEFV